MDNPFFCDNIDTKGAVKENFYVSQKSEFFMNKQFIYTILLLWYGMQSILHGSSELSSSKPDTISSYGVEKDKRSKIRNRFDRIMQDAKEYEKKAIDCDQEKVKIMMNDVQKELLAYTQKIKAEQRKIKKNEQRKGRYSFGY